MSTTETQTPALPALWHQLEARASRHRTPIPGGEMTWRVWGEGPPVVLFHGMHGSWTHWLKNIDTLAARHRVLVPDMPGFGDSDLGVLPTADAFSAAVAAGLEPLGVTGGFDLVAFSFGSTVSFHLPDAVKARVRRIVLIGSAGLGPFRRVSTDLTSWRGVGDPAERARIHAANLAVMMFADPARIDEGAVALQMANTERMTLHRKALIRSADAMGRFRAWRPQAVDFVWGAEDLIIREALPETRPIIAGIVPAARFHIIEGAGHWAQFEDAPAVNRLLAAL